MCTFIQTHWQWLSALAIGVFAVWKYFDTRRRELAWRRTEFIFEQARLLDTDEDLADAVSILEGRHETVQLASLYPDQDELDESSYSSLDHHKMDKLLNFLDRLTYATSDAKTLSISEVVNFGWYFKLVAKHPGLKKYCRKNGFADTLALADKMMKDKTQKDWV